MKKLLFILILIICISSTTYLLLPPQIPFSPRGSGSSTPQIMPENQYVILGFTPYWNMRKVTPQSLKTITHFAYFALHLRGDGTLYTHVNRQEEDPGYTNYKRLLAKPIGSNLILTYMQEDEGALKTMLGSATARRTAVETILKTMQESSATGVNIDLEPVGVVTPTDRNNFTSFIKELKSHFSTNNSPLLSYSSNRLLCCHDLRLHNAKKFECWPQLPLA
jgi:spore germination protein YaaH